MFLLLQWHQIPFLFPAWKFSSFSCSQSGVPAVLKVSHFSNAISDMHRSYHSYNYRNDIMKK